MKRKRTLHRPRLVALVLLGATLPARADVLVVDQAAAPGSDFTNIQLAIDAALEGDTILIRDGSYQWFSIDGKSLSVIADGDSVVASLPTFGFSRPTIEVRNLALGQMVLVRGIQSASGVGVLNCAGPVWFEDLAVSGNVNCGPGGTAGAYVMNSSKVTLTRCMLRGESNTDSWFFHSSADGIHAVSSTIQLFDCQVKGGWGEDSTFTPIEGGAGIRIEESTVTIIGCTIEGGEGGLNFSTLCVGGHASGGAGIEFVDATGTVRSAASTAVGGAADLDATCPGQMGPPGPAVTGGGTIVALAGFARQLQANSPVRGGEVLTFEVGGVAGELPLVLVSLVHEPLPWLALNSVLLLGLPASDFFVLAPLPASGQATLALPIPNLGANAENLTYYAQVVFLDTEPAIWLGAGTSVVLLDSSF